MSEYPDCMVDLETTGTTNYDRTGIIQIAAIRFNFETGEVDPDFFNRCMTLPPHRYWDESTRNWWLERNRETLKSIMSRMEPPQQVMEDFVKWAFAKGQMRLWAKPSHFEHPYIASYCKDFGLPCPFHYRTTMDCRSFATGLFYPDEPLDPNQVQLDGVAHDAIFDALHQIKFLMEAKNARAAH